MADPQVNTQKHPGEEFRDVISDLLIRQGLRPGADGKLSASTVAMLQFWLDRAIDKINDHFMMEKSNDA